MAYKTPNPVQKIQGFVENGSATVTTTGMQTTTVPQTYPGARIKLFHAGTNAQARFYNELGVDQEADFIIADANGFYSFFAETGRYALKFFDPNIQPPQEPVEIAPAKELKVESRTFNVRDYGAKGDGMADDTQAIRAALSAMIASNSVDKGVGTLFFPSGSYHVSQQADLLPYILDLPSGIIIQGTAGPYTGTAISNCQIILDSPNTSIFRIRNNRHKITIRDLGMTSPIGDESSANTGTIAIEARQDVGPGFTNEIEFDNLTIWRFDRGISIEGSHILNPNPEPGHEGEFLQWDITGVRVNHCTIVECQYGIYTNSQNCSFVRILDSRIGANLDGYGMYFEKIGIITIDSILGAGQVLHSNKSDTFIFLTAARGTVTVINCECEGFDNSVQVTPLNTGNIAWPILFLNCAWGPQIQLNSQCEVVSIASRYLPQTVQCNELAEVMLYSFGDIIIGLDKQPNPAYNFDLNESDSRLVSRANRYRVDFQRPARFGGLPGQIAAWLEHTPLAISPLSEGEMATVALCNEAGNPIVNLRADDGALYFHDATEDRNVMKLELRTGNLFLRGQVRENSSL